MAQCASETFAERNFKWYKDTVTKKRSALGRSPMDGSDPTAIRLQNVNANASLADFNNLNLQDEEAFLQSFTLNKEAGWAKQFKDHLSSFTVEETRIAFKCFIEPFEDLTQMSLTDFRQRTVEFQIKRKYVHDVPLQLYDEDDGDGDAYQEHRKIVDINWVARRGWELVTVLVGSENDQEKNQCYLINSTLPPLIEAGNNPGFKMTMPPAET